MLVPPIPRAATPNPPKNDAPEPLGLLPEPLRLASDPVDIITEGLAPKPQGLAPNPPLAPVPSPPLAPKTKADTLAPPGLIAPTPLKLALLVRPEAALLPVPPTVVVAGAPKPPGAIAAPKGPRPKPPPPTAGVLGALPAVVAVGVPPKAMLPAVGCAKRKGPKGAIAAAVLTIGMPPNAVPLAVGCAKRKAPKGATVAAMLTIGVPPKDMPPAEDCTKGKGPFGAAALPPPLLETDVLPEALEAAPKAKRGFAVEPVLGKAKGACAAEPICTPRPNAGGGPAADEAPGKADLLVLTVLVLALTLEKAGPACAAEPVPVEGLEALPNVSFEPPPTVGLKPRKPGSTPPAVAVLARKPAADGRPKGLTLLLAVSSGLAPPATMAQAGGAGGGFHLPAAAARSIVIHNAGSCAFFSARSAGRCPRLSFCCALSGCAVSSNVTIVDPCSLRWAHAA